MSDLIRRQAAIDAVDDYIGTFDAIDARFLDGLKTAKKLMMQVPSTQPMALTCDGCRNVGTYDTDFPCSVCIRREKDYYQQER